MDVIERARELRKQIENIATTMDDEQAMEYSELFANWSGDGIAYSVGDRVRYNGVLYKVLQVHTSQPDWTPEAAVSLFAKMLIPDPEVVPVWEQPDSTNPYMTGDRVYYPTAEDLMYESLIDNNVWSPDAYPQGWKVV